MLSYDRDHALSQDECDPLKHLRKEFIIPSKDDLNSKTLINPCKATFSTEQGAEIFRISA